MLAFVLGRWTAKGPLERDQERKANETRLRHAKAAMDRALRDEVTALLGQRKKIEAIKLVRLRLNVDLKDAKDLVEDLDRGRAG